MPSRMWRSRSFFQLFGIPSPRVRAGRSASAQRGWLAPLVVSALALGTACDDAPSKERHLVTAKAVTRLEPAADPIVEAGGRRLEATFDRRMRLVGVRAPDEVQVGERAAFTLYFEVLGEVLSDPKVFVHGRVPGAELNQLQADHELVGGTRPPSEWGKGDILVDAFTVAVPRNFPGERLELFAGLYEGKERWRVTSGEHDGSNRVRVASVPVKGGAPSEMRMNVVRRRGPIRVDGVLDEADWARAERAGPFIAHDGRRKIKNQTFVRALWDDEYLYVAFECDDDDIHTPYTKRDDPLYESEVVEVFLDADGDKDVYVELQAAPNDVHFDAAFAGGRRKNFDTKYDVGFETKAKLRGTLNDDSDVDEGWVSEWRIPIAQIRDVPGPIGVGVEWKANFFRLDRRRREGRVVGTEASAWSSPLSGDFHNLDRFGTLVFVE